jgi:hypothetical protein
MIFESHQVRRGLRHEHTIWFLRRQSTRTHDGMYTIGKLQRKGTLRDGFGPLHLTLNGDTWLALEEAEEIVDFMKKERQ